MALSRRGKKLGGAAPRRTGRWIRQSREPLRPEQPFGVLGMVAGGLFVLGGVLGFAWAVDRDLQGGVVEQRAEAQQRPDWVYGRNLPPYVADAFVAVAQPSLLSGARLRPEQDERSIARELVQQVHRVPSTMRGEARGMVMAPLLERRLDSGELVELYLNRVYLGRAQGEPVYGVHHASREYFGTDPTQLTLSHAATLAGLLLRPRIDDPKARLGAVGPRRNEVLRVMLDGELITPDEFRQAVAEPLGFQPGLEQMPFSRPANWGRSGGVIRLPPNLRPIPPDSAEEREAS